MGDMNSNAHTVASQRPSVHDTAQSFKQDMKEKPPHRWTFGHKSSGRMIQKRTSIASGLLSHDSGSRRIPLTYGAPHPEEEERSGILEKLKACDSNLDNLWDSRRAVLSDKLLCFSPLDSPRVVSDCIPTHEISQAQTMIPCKLLLHACINTSLHQTGCAA